MSLLDVLDIVLVRNPCDTLYVLKVSKGRLQIFMGV